MSYDLHGTWDKGNKWLGAFLNGHTNMTEITEYLDLFWRNDISASKMNLGLAFYARTFTPADKSCLDPGCMFVSGGSPGPCTDNVGTLSNAEIDRLLTTAPIFHPEAAVQVLITDDYWIAYDDEQSWRLKIDFALSQCFGGVMVWAISQDIPSTSKYARQLASATGWKSPNIASIHRASELSSTDDSLPKIKMSQCTWADCGENCPAGWTTPWRSNNDGGGKHGPQLMTDATACFSGSQRLLCCPPELPDGFECGWWKHGNGNCKGSCPSGYTEIGSNSQYCKGKKSGDYQAACCTALDPVMHVQGECHWNGEQGDCASSTCDSGPKVASSWSGSGAVKCSTYDSLAGYTYRAERLYCCPGQSDNSKFTSCTWHDNIGSFYPPYSPDYCRGGCPSGEVRVALNDYDGKKETDLCKSGSQALCCSTNYEATPSSGGYEAYNFLLDQIETWMADPQCPSTDPPSSKRSVDTGFDLIAREQTPSTPADWTADIFYHIIIGASIINGVNVSDILTAAISNNPHFVPFGLHVLFDYLWELSNYPLWVWELPWTILCHVNEWLDFFEVSPPPQDCPTRSLGIWDPENYGLDLDDGGSEDINEALRKRARHPRVTYLETLESTNGTFELIEIRQGGQGSPRRFRVIFRGQVYVITSQSYPNGADGDNLASRNGDNHRYAYSIGPCGETIIDTDADVDDANWVSKYSLYPSTALSIQISITVYVTNSTMHSSAEHILELQTIPRFIQFALSRVIQGGNLDPYETSHREITLAELNFILNGDAAWNANHALTPIDEMMNALGAMDNTEVLVNCAADLNGAKARVRRCL